MNDDKIWVCKTEDIGKRLDVFLSENMSEISRSAIQKIISEGLVSVDDNVIIKKNMLLESDMKIEIKIRDNDEINKSLNEIIAENIPLNIVYEDDYLLVVNKSQGMVVHPATSHKDGTLVNALKYHCGDKLSNVNGAERVGIVHRIDKDTSGLLMIAKTNDVHVHLAKQLKDKTTDRIYHAIVHGGFNFESGVNGATINKPIARHPKNRFKRAVVEGGKQAITHYELIEQYGEYSYIKLKLETGRTHQIRVHMNYIGHPVLCDEIYGIKNEKIKHKGQILHAKTLEFIHPVTNKYMQFDSKLPDYFVKVLDIIRK